jgi:hypothetical protein
MDLFINLMDHYKNLYDNTALASLDNDILLTLNEGKFLNEGFSKTFEDNEFLFQYIVDQPKPCVDTVYRMWCMLGNDKQLEVYNVLIK